MRHLGCTSLKVPCVFAAKGKGSGGVKTAKLYAWVALQTLPEEMVISPCLLDFLEKALETIPITPVERNYAGALRHLIFMVPVCQHKHLLIHPAFEIHRFLLFVYASALASQEEDMGQFDTVEPLEESTTSLVSSSTSAYSSFPVDVVVYVRVQVRTSPLLTNSPCHCVFYIPLISLSTR